MSTYRGMLLAEVMVAIAVFSALAMAAYQAYYAANFLADRADLKSDALFLAEEGIEATRQIRDQGWSNLTSGTKGLALTNNVWYYSGTSDFANGYMRTLALNVIDANTVQATSTVAWRAQGATSTVALSTILTNWRKTDSAADHFSINTSSACVYTLDPRWLGGVTLSADSSGGTLTVSSVQASWVSTSRNLNLIYGAYPTVAWSGTSVSGTTNLLTTPVTIAAGTSRTFYFRWDGSVTGKNFTLNFIMSDGSSKSVTINTPILSLCIVL